MLSFNGCVRCSISHSNAFGTPGNRAMALCCLPRCPCLGEAVRTCPRCGATFSLCRIHRYRMIQCPWQTTSRRQCLAEVPLYPCERAGACLYEAWYYQPFQTSWFPEPPPGLVAPLGTHHSYASTWYSEPLFATSPVEMPTSLEGRRGITNKKITHDAALLNDPPTSEAPPELEVICV